MDPESSVPTILTTILFFFFFFSLFYFYFSCGTASLSIFGNTHWTLKIAPPNIITNSEHHSPLFFPDFCPYFFAIFYLAERHFPYLEIHRTLKIAPQNIITNSDHHPPLFFLSILWLFFIWHRLTFHIWKYTLDPENSTPKHHHQQ
jgi:hypothetical protein